MSLLAPLSLLWLLPAAGAVVALYLLRVKRRDVTVPSTLLWEQILQDSQANAPFQRLRRNLLLVLQLLAVVGLALALARPFLWSVGLGGRSTALVLDASASMRATDEPGGRFAAAVARAREMVARKSPGDAVAVILAADRPTVLCPLTTDRARLDAALRDTRPTDAVGDIREGIALAATLVGSRAGARVAVFTDGAWARHPEPLALGGAGVDFILLGKRAENVAVTAFDVRDTLGGGAGRQAFVTVQNFSPRPRTVPLEITVDGELIDAHEVRLGPNESKSEVFASLRAADTGGVVAARLDARDDLTADDSAALVLPPRRSLKLLLVSDGNPFFERALTADEHVTLRTVAPAAYKPADSARHDATIWDNAAPPATLPPDSRHLFWGPKCLTGSPLLPAVAAKQPDADRPQILDWSRAHPLMRFVDLANVQLRRARAIAPAPWATTLAEAESGPLIVAGERSNTRAVYVAFDVLDSDMPLRVAFPVFVANAVQWLAARPGDAGGASRPGDPLPLDAPPSAATLTLTRPDGSTTRLTPRTPYRDTPLVGLYKAAAPAYARTYAVSLLSAPESNLTPNPRPTLEITDTAPTAATPRTSLTTRRELWRYVAAFVLLALLAEWWAYHRRSGRV